MPRKKKYPDKYNPAPMPKDADIDAVLSRIHAARRPLLETEIEPDLDSWLTHSQKDQPE